MLTAKINVGALKAAALAASKELSRHYLNGVLIEVSPRAVVYVATDGQMLFAYRDGLSERDPDNMLLGDFIVPVPVIKSIKLKKSVSESASLRDSTNGDGELTIKTADGGSYGFAPIDGTFPNWRAVRRGRPAARPPAATIPSTSPHWSRPGNCRAPGVPTSPTTASKRR